jgi:hypothetical protein
MLFIIAWLIAMGTSELLLVLWLPSPYFPHPLYLTVYHVYLSTQKNL